MDYGFHWFLVNLCKVRGEMCVSESVALVLIESDKEMKLTVRGHRPILFCIIVFIFWADLQRLWSTTEQSLLSVLTYSNGKIAKWKRWKVSPRYIFAICTRAKKKKKKCLLLLLLFLFSDRLWIDSVTLALIAWIFYTEARSDWICSDSCYSNMDYVGYDAPKLIWGIALWSLFIHLGQFLHKSR